MIWLLLTFQYCLSHLPAQLLPYTPSSRLNEGLLILQAMLPLAPGPLGILLPLCGVLFPCIWLISIFFQVLASFGKNFLIPLPSSVRLCTPSCVLPQTLDGVYDSTFHIGLLNF